MGEFIVYPAIDLRGGKVVRLAQGDPDRQTAYSDDPTATAQRWLEVGARWLHVVNLDGAFGEADSASRAALQAIISVAAGARVQFGGGLRLLDDIDRALSLGVSRVVLGTLALEAPHVVRDAINRFGPESIAAGIDARDNQVRIRGWRDSGDADPVTLGKELAASGVKTAVFTNIARDGMGSGIDLTATVRLADETGLSVIASGGVSTVDDVHAVRAAGLNGVIIGRALYEGKLELEEALRC